MKEKDLCKIDDAFDLIWKEFDRISTEENHTASNIFARSHLYKAQCYFHTIPNKENQ